MSSAYKIKSFTSGYTPGKRVIITSISMSDNNLLYVWRTEVTTHNIYNYIS